MTEKEIFAEKLEEFVSEFKEHISTEDGQWTVKGFIDVFKNVYLDVQVFNLRKPAGKQVS